MSKQNIPSMDAITAERERIQYEKRYRSVILSTFFGLVTIVAIAILVSTMWLPFLRIHNDSMSPTLGNGDVVLCTRFGSYDRGDCVAFYFSNKILVRRIVGLPGEVIDIREDGSVTVDGAVLEENYLEELSAVTGNLTYPFEVPEDSYFVLGDNRENAIDSRYDTIGCIPEDRFIGELQLRLWPLAQLELI